MPDPAPRPPLPFVRRLPRATTVAAGVVIFVALATGLKLLAPFLQPFFVAVFFFYLGTPLSRQLQRWRVPAPLANLAVLPLAIALLAAVGWVIFVHVDDLRAKLPGYTRDFRATVTPLLAELELHSPRLAQEGRELVADLVSFSGGLGQLIGAVAGTAVSAVLGALLVVVFLVFLNWEAVTLPRRLAAAFGDDRAGRVLAVGRRTNKAIVRYVQVKTLASLLVAGLSTAVMSVMRVDLALLWGALTFFGNFIPYLGSAVAVVLPVSIAVLQWGSWPPVVILALLLASAQVLVGNFIEPRFAGIQLNLSPLVVILSLAFWGWLWGIIGLLLSIPLMVSLRLVLENLPTTRPLATLMCDRPVTSGAPSGEEE